MRGRARLGLAVGLIVALGATAQAVTMDWVTVGDAGNTADDTGYGAVGSEYRIGKFEITAGQYCELLNAKAAVDDPFGLYDPLMWSWTRGCKIQRTGSPGAYSYSVAADRADRPVNLLSFWDAARFANWMHNAQGSGDTETGAYINIGNQATFGRQPGALFFIPTEDEWYKAAYYKGGGTNAGYWDYPTQSDAAPTSEAPPGTDLMNGSANYAFAVVGPYYTTAVGAYTTMPSASAYGTFDQGGNLWEWNETVIGSSRGLRGGARDSNAGCLTSSCRHFDSPTAEYDVFGFRLASPAGPDVIPEPATVSLFGIAAVAAMLRRRRRRA